MAIPFQFNMGYQASGLLKILQIVVLELSCAICHENRMQIAQDNSGTTKYRIIVNIRCQLVEKIKNFNKTDFFFLG
jgi:hypothetical protein